ncbi:MAG TPA: TonB-dependent receptor, partial [Kofleriaceae bacterium]|nr:TonB-dependent receptor [Kofleriaceae bacterium]
LGGAALGGALDLITRVGPAPDGHRLRLDVGGGSFGARHLGARWVDGRADGSLGWHLAARYAGATGDYPYFDDRGTNLNQSDDAIVTRSNNGHDQIDLVARVAGGGAGTRARGGLRATARRQGVPGSGSVQSMTASLDSAGAVADGAIDRQGLTGSDRLAGGAAGWLSAEVQEYRDLDGEIGLSAQHLRYRILATGLRTHLGWAAPGGHRISAAVDGGLDWFAQTDLTDGGTARGHGLRLSGGAAAADDWRLAGDRIVLQPALRVDLLRTNPLGGADPDLAEPTRTEAHPSPRLAARAALAPALAIKASAGRYFRAPTVVELYGDRGWLVGNPALRAETGENADLGLVWAPDRRLGAADRLYAEVAGFAARPRDTIVYVPTAGLAAAPLNLGGARILGVEAAASARLGAVATLTANYTLLDTRQRSSTPSYDGRRLPQRPRHQLYARVDAARRVGHRLLVVWTDASLIAGNYLDPGNVSPVPARRLLGAGIKVEPIPDLLLGIEVANLTDERIESIGLDPPPRPDLTEVPRAISDFFGYPLPGRAIYVRAEWAH